MLWRFRAYGFLKNQRYFEPFLVLFLLEKGLSFFLIGVLVAFRELTVNLLEIPSGAVADVFGRRRSLQVSFLSYAASFLVFGWAGHLALLFAAMALFAVGDSFRTGTHKAMIFEWLRQQGRTSEKTRVYGLTRSWSKLGSALSILIAAGVVLGTGRYAPVFFLSALPCGLSILNLSGYPRSLEGEASGEAPAPRVWGHLRETFRMVRRGPALRGLMLESMGYEGVFHSVKDYLQPAIKIAVVPLAAGLLSGVVAPGAQGVALLAAPVYLVLYLLSAASSRFSHRLVLAAGDEDAGARRVWDWTLAMFVALGAFGAVDAVWPLMACFVLLHVLQNLWRPIQVSRFDAWGSSAQGATILSLESQARRLMTIVAAPLLGLAVDAVVQRDLGGPLWPVGVLGAVVSLFFVLRRGSSRPAKVEAPEDPPADGA